jgi:hypothetical protein
VNQRLRLYLWTLALLAILPPQSLAWNAPAQMLNGSLTYQILQRHSPQTINAVKAILQKHPWYETRWKAQLEEAHIDADEMLFMLAPRWADDVRTRDRPQHRAAWHYLNEPFKPNGQPESVKKRAPEAVNLLTALAENERIARNDNDVERKAIALTWLFHLVGDVHQPMHTVQTFTTAHPNGDRGGNEICIRPKLGRPPMNLHLFWDSAVTSSSNVMKLKYKAMAMRLKPEFSREKLTELASKSFNAWAKESFNVAAKMAYQNGAFLGTPKGGRPNCNEIDAAVLPAGYAKAAGRIGDRRIVLAGYRLVDVLRRTAG